MYVAVLLSSREPGRGTGTAEVTRESLAACVENPINAEYGRTKKGGEKNKTNEKRK